MSHNYLSFASVISDKASEIRENGSNVTIVLHTSMAIFVYRAIRFMALSLSDSNGPIKTSVKFFIFT